MPVLFGVPQGIVLGPLLFLVYIDDLPEKTSEGTCMRQFADDSLFYRRINATKDTEILQHDLQKLQQWETEWKMEFHPQKCKVIRITNKINVISGNYTIHNQILETSSKAEYLGVTLENVME